MHIKFNNIGPSSGWNVELTSRGLGRTLSGRHLPAAINGTG